MISSHRGGKQKKRNLEQCNRPCPIDVTLLLVTVPPHPSIVFGGRYSHSDATEQKERGHRSTGRRGDGFVSFAGLANFALANIAD